MSLKAKRIITALGLLITILGLVFYSYTDSEEKRAEVKAAETLRHINESFYDAGLHRAMTPDNFSKEYIEETVTIKGREYLGKISFPERDFEIAVLASATEEALKVSPCRQSGDIADGNLVIAGHNYVSHFGFFSEVKEGEKVEFTDVKGKAFSYTVSSIETVAGSDREGMETGDWDMTLFTCVYGNNRNRTALRLKLD